MLQLMNEIDKKDVEELNEEHNTNISNLMENDSNPVVAGDFITKDNNKQSYLPKEEQFSTITDQFSQAEPYSALPVDVSKIKTPIVSKIPLTLEQPEIVSPLRVTSSVNVPAIDHPRKIPSQKNSILNMDNVELISETPKQINSSEEIHSPTKSKTKPKRYLCEICINKGFTTKYSLKRHNNNFHKLNKSPKVLINEIEPSFTSPISQYNLKRSRDLSDDETDEFQNFPDSKKLKARGLKRNADPNTIYEQHLPRKSARIESFKRKNQWTENSPAKRLAIQKGQGFLNWINF